MRRTRRSYRLDKTHDLYNHSTLTVASLQKTKNGFLAFLDEWEFIIAPLIFTALAFFTRMWKIGLSDIVTWDEAQ